jgi:ATP-binding cassette, subfamily B, bacterial MsbA
MQSKQPHLLVQAWQVYCRLLQCARQFWLTFLFGLIATLLCATLDAVLVWSVKPMIDQGLIAKDAQFIYYLPSLLLGLFLLRALFSFSSDFFIYKTGRQIVQSLRQKCFAHIQSWPTHQLDKYKSSHIISTMIYTIEQVTTACTDSVLALLKDGLFIIMMLATMFHLSWQLTLLSLCSTPLLYFMITLATRKTRLSSQHMQTSIDAITQHTHQVYHGFKNIKLYHLHHHLQKSFDHSVQQNKQHALKIIMIHALCASSMQMIMAVPLAIAFYWMTHQTHAITIGTFMTIALAMGRLLQPIKRLSKINSDIQQGVVAAKNTFMFFDQPSEPNPGALTKKTITGALTLNKVCFHYPTQKNQTSQPILHDIDLTIAAGETIVLTGPSGSGKSTLTHLLLRFYQPNSGTITLDGHPLEHFELRFLRQQFSWVSQDPFLLDDTIYTNITFGTQATLKEVTLAAKKANIHDFIMTLPQGYQTYLQNQGGQLSGGQKQRLALARALLRPAPIIILDEATNALDHTNETNIYQNITTHAHHKTLIIITHRKEIIQQAPRLLVLNHGTITEYNNTEQNLKHSEKEPL